MKYRLTVQASHAFTKAYIQKLGNNLKILPYVHSTHNCKPLPEESSDTPYNASMCVYHMKNYQRSYLILHFKADTYIHYLNGYHGSLLILVTHETIVMHLRRK